MDHAATARTIVVRPRLQRAPVSDVEAEVHDVAVADGVVGAFEAHAAGILGALLAAVSDKILVGYGFGADEAFFEIGVDAAGGLRRPGAALDRPGVCLLGPDGQKRDQIEQRISGADDAVEPGFVEPERGEVLELSRQRPKAAPVRLRSPPRSPRPRCRAGRQIRRAGGFRHCRWQRSPPRHWRHRAPAWRSVIAVRRDFFAARRC